MTLAGGALLVVALTLLGELWVSRRNERRLLARGAEAPPDPVYRTMRWAYPAVFLMMALDGATAPTRSLAESVAGLMVFSAAKALKYWAVASLGDRWTFRVLVLPGAPLVTTGPYRLMRHPNYVAVVGELVGMALLVNARYTGVVAVVLFGWLLRHRVQAEERALGLR